nr:46 kda heme-containing ascorbate oxidase {N-terminal} [Pleurotus ostreatus, Peptide Partial, 15 aa] [Pleurotus ostreatus]
DVKTLQEHLQLALMV